MSSSARGVSRTYSNRFRRHYTAACRRGHIDVVKLLIEAGVDVNAEEEFPPRGTPLEYALKNDNPELVRLLLEQGANPNHGREVFRALTGNKKNSVEVIKLLEKHGADLHRLFVNESSKEKESMNALSVAIAWGKEDAARYLRSRGAVLPPASQLDSPGTSHQQLPQP